VGDEARRIATIFWLELTNHADQFGKMIRVTRVNIRLALCPTVDPRNKPKADKAAGASGPFLF
jgi:hypothetical protein